MQITIEGNAELISTIANFAEEYKALHKDVEVMDKRTKEFFRDYKRLNDTIQQIKLMSWSAKHV